MTGFGGCVYQSSNDMNIMAVSNYFQIKDLPEKMKLLPGALLRPEPLATQIISPSRVSITIILPNRHIIKPTSNDLSLHTQINASLIREASICSEW